MKAKEIISCFKDIDPEQEVIVAWWDKSFVEEITEKKLTDEQWNDVVDKAEDREWCDVNEHLAEIVTDVTEE